jgi:hypothetical protein
VDNSGVNYPAYIPVDDMPMFRFVDGERQNTVRMSPTAEDSSVDSVDNSGGVVGPETTDTTGPDVIGADNTGVVGDKVVGVPEDISLSSKSV